jgi:3-oxoacyl-[acyl-carrier protein] reductase
MKRSTRVALVTGGTRGIGLSICQSLAAEGFALAVNGVRSPDEVTDVVADLSKVSPAVGYFRTDIGDLAQHNALLRQIKGQFGRLDVLVNNAGVAPTQRADLLEAGVESFDRLIAVNLKGPHFLTQAVAKWMVEQKSVDDSFQGCIVNVTSVSATRASVNRGEYCISKAGLSMSTKLWAVRMAEFDILVYEVRPGIILTDMTSGVMEKYDRMIEDGLLLEARVGNPEDVGRVVAMLARGDLPYATGSVLNIDGGLSVERL